MELVMHDTGGVCNESRPCSYFKKHRKRLQNQEWGSKGSKHFHTYLRSRRRQASIQQVIGQERLSSFKNISYTCDMCVCVKNEPKKIINLPTSLPKIVIIQQHLYNSHFPLALSAGPPGWSPLTAPSSWVISRPETSKRRISSWMMDISGWFMISHVT